MIGQFLCWLGLHKLKLYPLCNVGGKPNGSYLHICERDDCLYVSNIGYYLPQQRNNVPPPSPKYVQLNEGSIKKNLNPPPIGNRPPPPKAQAV